MGAQSGWVLIASTKVPQKSFPSIFNPFMVWLQMHSGFFTFIQGIAFPKGSGEVPSELAPTHLPRLQNIQRMFRPAGENGMVSTNGRGSFIGEEAVCRTGREASMKANHVEMIS